MEKYFFIGLGALVALGIVLNRRDKLLDENNPDFREGYTAGFLTPGPFTILGIAGVVAYHAWEKKSVRLN